MELTAKIDRHDLGSPIYRSPVRDNGDHSLFGMPDGRIGRIRTQSGGLAVGHVSGAVTAYHQVSGGTELAEITYRLCDWDPDTIQVLSYELADGSPPAFTGCPVLKVAYD